MTFEEVVIKIKSLLAVMPESTPEKTDTSTLVKLVTDHIAQYIKLEDMKPNPRGFYEQLKTSWYPVCELLQLLPQQYYDETLNSLKSFIDTASKRRALELITEETVALAESISANTHAIIILNHCQSLLVCFKNCPADFPNSAATRELTDRVGVNLAYLLRRVLNEHVKTSNTLFPKILNNWDTLAENKKDQEDKSIITILLDKFTDGSMSYQASSQFLDYFSFNKELRIDKPWHVGCIFAYLLVRMPENHPFRTRVNELFFSQFKTLILNRLATYNAQKYGDLIVEVKASSDINQILQELNKHFTKHHEQAITIWDKLMQVFSSDEETKILRGYRSVIQMLNDVRIQYLNSQELSPVVPICAKEKDLASGLSYPLTPLKKQFMPVVLDLTPPLLPPSCAQSSAQTGNNNGTSHIYYDLPALPPTSVSASPPATFATSTQLSPTTENRVNPQSSAEIARSNPEQVNESTFPIATKRDDLAWLSIDSNTRRDIKTSRVVNRKEEAEQIRAAMDKLISSEPILINPASSHQALFNNATTNKATGQIPCSSKSLALDIASLPVANHDLEDQAQQKNSNREITDQQHSPRRKAMA